MTLALHGKSRQRQALLVLAAILAVAIAAAALVASPATLGLADNHQGPPQGFGQEDQLPIEWGNFSEEGDCGPYETGDGYVWHFVTGAGSPSFVSLTATFEDAGQLNAVLTDAGEGNENKHAWIVTPTADTLTGASAVTDPANGHFVLSHVCDASGSDPELSKTADGYSVAAGVAAWTISIDNTDADAINRTVIVDDPGVVLAEAACGASAGDTVDDLSCTVNAGQALSFDVERAVSQQCEAGSDANSATATIGGQDIPGSPANDINVTIPALPEDDPACSEVLASPNLFIQKVDGDGQQIAWEVTVAGPEYGASGAQFDVPATGSLALLGITPGEYTITEASVAGWQVVDVTVDGVSQGATASVNVTAEDDAEVQVVFQNEEDPAETPTPTNTPTTETPTSTPTTETPTATPTTETPTSTPTTETPTATPTGETPTSTPTTETPTATPTDETPTSTPTVETPTTTPTEDVAGEESTPKPPDSGSAFANQGSSTSALVALLIVFAFSTSAMLFTVGRRQG